MTNLQLFREISALPPHLKQDVINYVKKISGSSYRGISTYKVGDYLSDTYLNEPDVVYNAKNSFLDLLLSGPTFSEKQVQKIIDSRKL